MKRRQWIHYASASLLATAGCLLFSGLQPYLAQATGSLTIRWLGHTSFLFIGSGKTLLSNPFRPVGCTAKYRPVKVTSDLVMISSQLLDEGFVENLPGDPKLLFDPGIYRVDNLQIQGIQTVHDREGGRRFGQNLVWKWTQGGINVLHLGGTAAPITLEQQILMGRPDVLLVPVGGGPKAYNPEEAKQAIDTLKPRIVIPTQYRTQAADPAACNLVDLEAFLQVMSGVPVKRVGSDTLSLRVQDIPKETQIYVLSYKF